MNLNDEKLSAEDIRQGRLVEHMRQHPGFPVLVEFWNAQREALIAAGKAAAKKKNEFDARAFWCTLDGFDKACSMVEKIASRAEAQVEREQLEKEGSTLANG